MSASHYTPEELLIFTIARLLDGVGHVATGVQSPIPGGGAFLARELSGGRTRLSIIGSTDPRFRLHGPIEFFDQMAQGRIGAFFLGGGQIDGHANVNLVGVGEYPQQTVRWGGSYGSGFLYYMVPRVILFREEHTTRTLVPEVDFVSAPGPRDDGVYRPGGPYGLLTGRCWFEYDRGRRGFRLASVHPGHTVEEVRENTGFDFDIPEDVPETPAPEAETLATIRGPVARALADPYPAFAERVFGVRAARTA